MTDSKKRRGALLRLLAGLLALGLGYAWVVTHLGVGLPCPFYTLTGLLCPGCGVSRLCLALLRGDWAGAWAANPALCLLALPIGALLLCRAVGYVKGRGSARWEARSWLTIAVLLLVFGMARNLPML